MRKMGQFLEMLKPQGTASAKLCRLSVNLRLALMLLSGAITASRSHAGLYGIV